MLTLSCSSSPLFTILVNFTPILFIFIYDYGNLQNKFSPLKPLGQWPSAGLDKYLVIIKMFSFKIFRIMSFVSILLFRKLLSDCHFCLIFFPQNLAGDRVVYLDFVVFPEAFVVGCERCCRYIYFIVGCLSFVVLESFRRFIIYFVVQ